MSQIRSYPDGAFIRRATADDVLSYARSVDESCNYHSGAAKGEDIAPDLAGRTVYVVNDWKNPPTGN